MVIPQVLDKNQSLCLILTRFLHVSPMGELIRHGQKNIQAFVPRTFCNAYILREKSATVRGSS